MIPEKPRRAVNTIIAEAVVDTMSQYSSTRGNTAV